MTSFHSSRIFKILFASTCLIFLLLFVQLSCSVMSPSSRETDLASKSVVETFEETKEAEKGFIEDGKKSESAQDQEGAEEPSGIKASTRLATTESLRVKTPETLARFKGGELDPMPLLSHDIYAVVVGHRMRVVYDMVFQNPSDLTLQGTLMVELPDGASPCYLGMYDSTMVKSDMKAVMNPEAPGADLLLSQEIALPPLWKTDSGDTNWGGLKSARITSPVQGRRVYEEVVRRRVDPALTEWAGGGRFSTRIYPVSPRSMKRVVFAYDASLENQGDSLISVLPVPDKLEALTRITIYAVGDFFASQSVVAGSRFLSAEKTQFGQSWGFVPDPNFTGSLIFTGVPKDKKIQVLAGRSERIPGKLVHLRVVPDLPKTGKARPTGRAIFVLDTSYSGKDKLYALSGKLLRQILERDTTITEFAVLGFDVQTRSFTSGFMQSSKEARERIFSLIEGIWLEGATNLSGALQFIAKSAELRSADTFFLLSDGQITWGTENPVLLSNAFPELLEKPWICYALGGSAVNRPLFETLTRGSGRIITVTASQPLADAAIAHLRPSYTLDSVATETQDETLTALDPKIVYPGQVLEVAVRARDSAAMLRLAVTINGNKMVYRAPLVDNPLSTGIAARSWAEIYVGSLLALYDSEANAIALSLSQAFSLTNREASFIILETDEEYVQHKIENEKLDLASLRDAALRKRTNKPIGEPDTGDIPQESLALINALGKAKPAAVWKAETQRPLTLGLEAILKAPLSKRDKDTPVALYLEAKELYSRSPQSSFASAQALRVLSSVVEISPQDDQAARLAGFMLLEWNMYAEAAELFARILERRPFEPQSFLENGIALAALGRLREAAVMYELVLAREYPRFSEYVKPVAVILYSDLLNAVIRSNPQDPEVELALNRLAALKTDARLPAGRIVLFWNLDNTDVDLHVRESLSEEVYYSRPNSSTGGRLFWDNTTGLGPELYEHPTLKRDGFDVFVHYFGNRDAGGAAPASTLVCAFTLDKNTLLYNARFYSTVLIGVQGDTVSIMPRWKAER